MNWTRSLSTSACFVMLLALPASTNFEMHDFGIGAGGVGVGTSTNYAVGGVVGEVSGSNLSGTTYDLGPGLQFARQTNTPAAPTITNPSNYYNKLRVNIDNGSNPTDTLFAIAISTDNFSTTNYVQADQTIGSTPVYQTYSTWGGGSGALVIGLQPSTTYYVKVKAVQTAYTESAYSSVASVATVTPTLSYDIDVSSSDSESGPPYIVAFGTLSVGSVTTASNKIWVDLDTNAEQGAFVYVYSNSAGLSSSAASYTITSASGDLTGVSEGFGLRVDTSTQSSGGPLTAVSPYNGSSDTVGILNTTSRNIFTSANAPIVGGRGSVWVKAKAATTTPAASDYATIVTMIASATF